MAEVWTRVIAHSSDMQRWGSELFPGGYFFVEDFPFLDCFLITVGAIADPTLVQIWQCHEVIPKKCEGALVCFIGIWEEKISSN